MTMTEAPPAEGSTPTPDGSTAAPPARVRDAVVDSADHKRLGLTYLALALVAFLGVRVVGAALGAELTKAGVQIIGDDSRRLFGLYESGLVLLFLAPLWAGLATYVLPLQLGASRLAFPRVQAFALWTTVGGSGLFVAGHLIDPPPGIGLSDVTPLRAPVGGVNDGTNLILVGILLLAVASLVTAGNLLTTALTLRADGMTLSRMPLFAWSIVVSSAGVLLATPVFLAGAILLYLDLHFGGSALFEAGKNGDLVWQKSLWLYGRPEIFLLALPGLGAACDIVVTTARRPIADPPTPPVPAGMRRRLPPMPGVTSPLKGHMLGVGALCAFGGLSLLTWSQGQSALHAMMLPTATVGTTLVVLPVLQLVLLWLGTLGQAKPKPTLALGFVFAALVVWAAAGANAIAAAVAEVHATSVASGQIELVAIGAPTILAFGALHHWSPKLFGTRLSTAAGGLVLLTSLAGTLAVGLGQSWAGAHGAQAHLKDVAGSKAHAGFAVAEIGHMLLLLAGLVLALDVIRALASGRRGEPTPADLRDGVTLEWATSSPPPLANFDEVPEVRSEAPILDVLAAKEGK
jgi:heme/copper-type cytochrome/quinol oxidase subunit 1